MQRAFNGKRARGIQPKQVKKIALDTAIRIEVTCGHVTTKNNIKLGSGSGRPDENTVHPGVPRLEHNHRTALSVISGTVGKTLRESRRFKSEEENLNRLEAGPPGGCTPDGP
jgi:hypothetical protein